MRIRGSGLLTCRSKTFILSALTAAVVAAGAFAQERQRINGEVAPELDLTYRAKERSFAFEFPLQVLLQISYEAERVKALAAVDYYAERAVPIVYVAGGTEYSNMKIGYFIEEWGRTSSMGSPAVLNARDDRYPDNVFFSSYFRPAPIWLLTAGNEKQYIQAALSNRADQVDSIDETDLGLRAVIRRQSFSVGSGMIRKLGAPPPLFFLALEQSFAGGTPAKGSLWMEADWEFLSERPDIWDASFGFKRAISDSEILAEYILRDREDFIFLGETLRISRIVKGSLGVYFHFPEFSGALKGYLSVDAGDRLSFEPGFTGFYGKRGSPFSPFIGANNNILWMKLRFIF